jgi:hypothetical protein
MDWFRLARLEWSRAKCEIGIREGQKSFKRLAKIELTIGLSDFVLLHRTAELL